MKNVVVGRSDVADEFKTKKREFFGKEKFLGRSFPLEIMLQIFVVGVGVGTKVVGLESVLERKVRCRLRAVLKKVLVEGGWEFSCWRRECS